MACCPWPLNAHPAWAGELCSESTIRIVGTTDKSATNGFYLRKSKCLAAGSNNPSGDSSKCVVCCDRDADALILECGHYCMCYVCAVQNEESYGVCPMCRGEISRIVNVYRS